MGLEQGGALRDIPAERQLPMLPPGLLKTNGSTASNGAGAGAVAGSGHAHHR